MKYLFAILFCIMFFKTAYSQHVKLLLGKTENAVLVYFDSLNKVGVGNLYPIKKSTSNDGDIMIVADFDPESEGTYNCISIVSRFTRIRGNEMCTGQLIIGSQKYAESNLAYIKDNFTRTQEGNWEKWFGADKKIKIIAIYKADEIDGFKGYTIDYSFIFL